MTPEWNQKSDTSSRVFEKNKYENSITRDRRETGSLKGHFQKSCDSVSLMTKNHKAPYPSSVFTAFSWALAAARLVLLPPTTATTCPG
jgi:hypothetical protein